MEDNQDLVNRMGIISDKDKDLIEILFKSRSWLNHGTKTRFMDFSIFLDILSASRRWRAYPECEGGKFADYIERETPYYLIRKGWEWNEELKMFKREENGLIKTLEADDYRAHRASTVLAFVKNGFHYIERDCSNTCSFIDDLEKFY